MKLAAAKQPIRSSSVIASAPPRGKRRPLKRGRIVPQDDVIRLTQVPADPKLWQSVATGGER